MTARSPLASESPNRRRAAPLGRWLALALLCCALGSAQAHADAKRGHVDDPLADTDTGEDDLTAAPSRNDSASETSDAPAQEPASERETNATDGAQPPAGGEGELETAAAEPSLQVEPFVGGGFGTRSLERPTKIGVQRMGTTAYPAIDAGLRVTAWPAASFSLSVLLHYQTSVGMSVREQPPFALHNEVGVRSEHVELSAAPTFRLGEDAGGLAVAFPIGFTLRTFWPEVHKLMTPGYSLGGPLVRAELIVPLRDLLVLRIGPEFQWIVMIDHVLTDDGMASQAVGIGGEATLALRLSPVFALQLAYREVHVLAPNDTVGGQSFRDVERYLTLGFSGRF
jgi:hypothetical protein